MASGHVNRTQRPNTWLLRPDCDVKKVPCQRGAVHTWHKEHNNGQRTPPGDILLFAPDPNHRAPSSRGNHGRGTSLISISGQRQPDHQGRQCCRFGADRAAQLFTCANYFHRRPCAKPDPRDPSKNLGAPYNAADWAGANLAPTNKALIVKADMEKLKAEDPTVSIPIEPVTTSGSGLDPDISPKAALFQVAGVGKSRNMPEDRIRDLVNQPTGVCWA